MSKLHDITIQLVDARLATLQRQISSKGNTCPQLDSCIHLQRELKRLLLSEEFRPDYAEGLILFNNCQAVAESLLEENMVNEAQDTFETECLLLTNSDFGGDESPHISTRMAEHVLWLLLCLPPEGAAMKFRPFITAAMNMLPDPSGFSDALTLAMEKIMITDDKSADTA